MIFFIIIKLWRLKGIWVFGGGGAAGLGHPPLKVPARTRGGNSHCACAGRAGWRWELRHFPIGYGLRQWANGEERGSGQVVVAAARGGDRPDPGVRATVDSPPSPEVKISSVR